MSKRALYVLLIGWIIELNTKTSDVCIQSRCCNQTFFILHDLIEDEQRTYASVN